MKSKIGLALSGLGQQPESESLEAAEPLEMDEEEGSQTQAEVAAMKLFMKASSPEAKAEALKSFLEACGYTSG